MLQLNKRDLPKILPAETLAKELRRKNEPMIEAIAFQGVGVFDTLKEIARQVLTELKHIGDLIKIVVMFLQVIHQVVQGFDVGIHAILL